MLDFMRFQFVINADNLKSLEFAIVENVQRKDLNPIEEVEGIKD